jgi:hypothetical protein
MIPPWDHAILLCMSPLGAVYNAGALLVVAPQGEAEELIDRNGRERIG